MSESHASPEGLLPCDVTVEAPWVLKATGVDKLATPPTYNEIVDGIAPADDPDKWFLPAERATAAWLRARGLDVRSVQRRDGHLLKTPDAVAVSAPVTIELKGATGSVNSIVQRIREGRWQARRVVVDARGTGTSRAAAEDGLRRALTRYQDDLDEVVVIVTDDLSVGWGHG